MHTSKLNLQLIPDQYRAYSSLTHKGPSIKYVTLFLANFDPSPCHTLSHIPGHPPKVRHTSRTPPIFSSPSTKNPDKSPLYKFYQSFAGVFVRGVLSGGLLSERFCRGRFLFGHLRTGGRKRVVFCGRPLWTTPNNDCAKALRDTPAIAGSRATLRDMHQAN